MNTPSDPLLSFLNPFPSNTGIAGAGSLNSNNGIGRLLSYTAWSSLSGFTRGAAWGGGADAGIFMLNLGVAPSYAGYYFLGFRVAK